VSPLTVAKTVIFAAIGGGFLQVITLRRTLGPLALATEIIVSVRKEVVRESATDAVSNTLALSSIPVLGNATHDIAARIGESWSRNW
jgi:hypothetical protein